MTSLNKKSVSKPQCGSLKGGLPKRLTEEFLIFLKDPRQLPLSHLRSSKEHHVKATWASAVVLNLGFRSASGRSLTTIVAWGPGPVVLIYLVWTAVWHGDWLQLPSF